MSYSNILSLIDAELELLLAVRKLLSDKATPVQHPKKKRSLQRTAEEPASAAEPITFEPMEPPAELAQAAPKVRRLLTARTRPVSRKRKALPAESRALATSIPTGPIAVSAAAVAERRETTVREAAARSEHHEEAVVAEGTLDALLRELKVRETAA